MSERRSLLQCFNKEPHEGPHDWTLLYSDVPTPARCMGVEFQQPYSKLFNEDITEVGREFERVTKTIPQQINAEIEKRLLTIFGGEEQLREMAKYYVIEERPVDEVVDVTRDLYQPNAHRYSFEYEVVIRPKTAAELAEELRNARKI